MKIPTILALALIITAILLAGGLYYLSQKNQQAEKIKFHPTDIKVVNLSDTSTTIVWETKEPTGGQIAFGENSFSLNRLASDNRNRLRETPRLMHFVSLKGLKSDTKYYYQIKIGDYLYPEEPLDFKTAKSLEDTGSNLKKPVRGTVLDLNLNPIDEALVFLHLDDGSDIATFTSTGGNFILPLIDLRSKDLSSDYNLSSSKEAVLQIKRAGLISEIQIVLPTEELLPPITIGQNINLKNYQEKPEQIITFDNQQPSSPSSQFDLNSDGKINSLDLSLLREGIEKKSTNLIFDFNSDGKVDDKDAENMSQAIR